MDDGRDRFEMSREIVDARPRQVDGDRTRRRRIGRVDEAPDRAAV
jgi:hypothetical protein